MSTLLWIVAALSFSLPSDHRLIDNTSEVVTQHGFKAKEEFRSWASANGKALVLFYWEPMPLRDRGPMVVKEQWPFEFAGQKVQIFETSVFMGMQQQVLVTYLKFSGPDSQVMIYGKGYSRQEFEALLHQSDLKHTSR